MTTASLTATEFRRALGHFATGVTVITAARAPGRVHGMTANSFTSVSLEPLLILVCVAQDAQMLGVLREQKRFGVNVLKTGQQAVSEFFAQPGQAEDAEKALGVRFRWTPSGIPLLEDTLAQLACNVVFTHVAGDHTILLGEVNHAEISTGDPLLFYRGKYCDLPSPL